MSKVHGAKCTWAVFIAAPNSVYAFLFVTTVCEHAALVCSCQPRTVTVQYGAQTGDNNSAPPARTLQEVLSSLCEGITLDFSPPALGKTNQTVQL